MNKKYNPNEFEKKWINEWEESGIYKTPKDVSKDNKMYILPQLPYPSGAGLHVGHAEGYTACDIFARYQRMKGKKVLQVIGWDSFGLPAENYAIKTNIHPKVSTDNAINNFRNQIKRMGISVDWDREVGSHNPDYYKWTQWFFLLMYNQGLAYRDNQKTNWCPQCKTVLANDQVKDGKCERCDTVVEQKEIEVWYFKITDYAERLSKDLLKLDWPAESIKRQKDWIGVSKGATVKFGVSIGDNKHINDNIEVFTTRIDTIFGASFLVVAPEHPILEKYKDKIKNFSEINKYVIKASKKTEFERQLDKEKSGVKIEGLSAVNPFNDKELPIYISDYVLMGYGTGAIMGVPAHDERDYEFAKKFGLPIIDVVIPIFYNYDCKPEKSEVFRKSISAVVHRKSDNKFLFVKWNRYNWICPVIGGIEEGEDELKAAERKVFEETGYKCRSIRKLGSVIESHFFADHKNEWRYRIDQPVLLELIDDCPENVSEGEKESLTPLWLTYDEVLRLNTFEENRIGVDRYLNKNQIFTDYGRSINSGEFSGLKTEEAQREMIKWAEKKGIGKGMQITKLHDWSVSRQRFWGAPIPMVYKPLNEEESKLQISYKLAPSKVVQLHDWNSKNDEHFYQWLYNELVSKNVESIVSDFPDSKRPIFDEWVKITQNFLGNTEENVVLIGHGLSAWSALKVAENKRLRKLVLLGAVSPVPEYIEGLKNSVNDKTELDYIYKFVYENKLNYQKIQENVGELVFYLSTNDGYIPFKETECWIKENFPFARIVRVREAGHFDEKNGYSKFPKLLEEVFSPVRMDLKKVYDSDLPILLPDDVDFVPTGKSPLTYSQKFQEDVEKKYGKDFKREVDTLDTFMCSSWYYLRYLDPKNDREFASKDSLDKWMPVDFYIGGPEHVTGHLLYSRFFTKVLYDAGYIDFDEPFIFHRHQGLILGEDNKKMSKRWGNVINPNDVIDRHGGDTLRLYEMFMGPLEDTKSWNTKGEQGIYRFLNKIWDIGNNFVKNIEKNDEKYTKQYIEINKLIKYTQEAIETLHFNTNISKFMEFINFISKEGCIDKDIWEIFLKVLSPYAPFITEELWHLLGHDDSVHVQKWPSLDMKSLESQLIKLPVQINGKVKGSIQVRPDITENEIKDLIQSDNKLSSYLTSGVKRIIYVKNRIVSVVV